jgi:flagellar assembly protein FliH
MSVRLIKAGKSIAVNAFKLPGPAGLDHLIKPAAPVAPVAEDPAPAAAQANGAPKRSENGGNGTATAAAAAKAPVETALDPNLVIGATKAEADRLVASAQARAAEIERAARDRGRAEAEAEAKTKLDRAVADLRAQLGASLDELAGLRSELAARAERDLVRLALEIARKVVHREVKVDREVALTLARVALERLNSRASAAVRLHPDDYAYVCERRERLGGESAIEIIEDRSVGLGGCIVQSEMGEIDARVEQQFAEIERDFLSA